MRRADRLLQIIQILRRYKKPISGEFIANELEVSLRTIYRDIQTLIIEGVPINGEAGVGYILGKGYDLPPLMFKKDELEAIILGLKWVGRRGDDALIRASKDAIAKINVVLPKDLKPILEEVALVVPPNFETSKDNIDVAIIRKAIRENYKISFEYQREDGQISQRTIMPLAISYFERVRLIISFCELRNDYRTFRTDRIKGLKLEQKHKMRRESLLKKWVEAQGYGKFYE